MLVGGAGEGLIGCRVSKMQSSWVVVVAFALCAASFSEGKSANLVLLTDAPGQSVRDVRLETTEAYNP